MEVSDLMIRGAQSEDYMLVHDLAHSIPPLTPHSPYAYWKTLTFQSRSCFIAEQADRPVGFITSEPTQKPDNEWFIWQIGVSPEFRGKGLALALQRRVVTVARRAGADALQTTIESDNIASLKSFEKLAEDIGSRMVCVNTEFIPPTADIPEVRYRIPLPGG